MGKNRESSESGYIFRKDYESSFISDVIETHNNFSDIEVDEQIDAIKNIIKFIKKEKEKGTSLENIQDMVFFNLNNIVELIKYPSLSNFYKLRTIEYIKGIDLKPYLEEIVKSKINVMKYEGADKIIYSANIENNIIMELCGFLADIKMFKKMTTDEEIGVLHDKIVNNKLEMSDIDRLNKYIQRYLKEINFDRKSYWKSIKSDTESCRKLLYKLKDRIFEVKTISQIEPESNNSDLSNMEEIKKQMEEIRANPMKSTNIANYSANTGKKQQRYVTLKPLTKSPFIGNDKTENFIIIMTDFFRGYDPETINLLYDLIELSEIEIDKDRREQSRGYLRDILGMLNYKNSVLYIRDFLLKRICILMTYFKATESLDSFCDRNNKRLQRSYLGELKIELEDVYKKFISESVPNGIYFFGKNMEYEKLCKDAAIYSISDEALVAMSATFVNRMAKIMPIYKNLGYILEKKDVIERIYNNPKLEYEDLGYTREDISTYMAMYKVLQDKVIQSSYRRDSNGNCHYDNSVSSDEIQRKLNKYRNVYEGYFRNMGFNFRNDLNAVMTDSELVDEMYKLKDFSVKSLLYTAITDRNKNIINWGVALNDDNNNSKFILLAFDIKSLNMPVFVHVKKDELIEFLKELTGDSKIQVYEGSGDMNNCYAGQRMSTQILYPVSKTEKKRMLKLSGHGANTRFFKHIKWMQEPNKEHPFSIAPGSREYNLETEEITITNRKKNASQPDASDR